MSWYELMTPEGEERQRCRIDLVLRLIACVAVFLTVPSFCQAQETRTPALTHPETKLPARVALVIGNANYRPKENVLDNPINDARLMTKTLQSLGFDVTEGEDLTKEQTNDLINKFKKRLIKGCVALFYYAGHAVQYRGAN